MKPNPNNFKVSDISEQTKLYCFYQFGYENLAEYFYSAFKANWIDRIEKGKPPIWKNPDLALKTWVRRSSPTAIRENMYSARVWEMAIAWCKDKQYQEEIKVPVPVIKTTPKPVNRELMSKNLKKLIIGMDI